MKETILSGLKKFMIIHNVSVIDLNWKILKKYRISMQKLLKWEMRNKYLTPSQ